MSYMHTLYTHRAQRCQQHSTIRDWMSYTIYKCTVQMVMLGGGGDDYLPTFNYPNVIASYRSVSLSPSFIQLPGGKIYTAVYAIHE